MPIIELRSTSNDKIWVKRLSEKLSSVGIQVVETNTQVAKDSSDRFDLSQDPDEATCVGLIISKDSVESGWLQKQLEVIPSKCATTLALKTGEKETTRENIFLPMLIESCSFIPDFSQEDCLYFTDGFSYRYSFGKLVNIIELSKSKISFEIMEFNNYFFELQPAAHSDVSEIQKLGQVFFQSEDLIPKERMEAWHAKDPNAFRVLKNMNGKIVAFFMVFFIKKRIFSEFVEGRIREYPGIEPSSLLAPSEKQKDGEDYIYISAIIGDKDRPDIQIYILLFFAKYLDLLRRVRTINKIYALAATNHSEMLLNTLGFTQRTPWDQRIDGVNFYVLDVSEITSCFDYIKNLTKSFSEFEARLDLSNEERWQPIFD